MRRHYPSPLGRSMFRANPRSRLLIMVGVLMVLLVVMFKIRDPRLFEWLQKKNEDDQPLRVATQAVSTVPAAQASRPTAVALADTKPTPTTDGDVKPTEPKATVPESGKKTVPPASGKSAERRSDDFSLTDTDPDEWADFEYDAQAIQDGSQQTDPIEMSAYWRMIHWIQRQPFDVLDKRAAPRLEYTRLYQEPANYRGKLVKLKLTYRRSMYEQLKDPNRGDDAEPVQFVEAWGFTKESQRWPIATVIIDPPEGFPIHPNINEQVTFVGYFYKKLGYYTANARPGDNPEYAPMLIGRIVWHPKVKVEDTDINPLWMIIAAGAIGAAAVIGIFMIFFQRRKSAFDLEGLATRSAPLPGEVETWLDEPPAEEFDSGEAGPDEGEPGNSF